MRYILIIALLCKTTLSQALAHIPAHKLQFAWDIHRTLMQKYHSLIAARSFLTKDSIIRPPDEYAAFDMSSYLRYKTISPVDAIAWRTWHKLIKRAQTLKDFNKNYTLSAYALSMLNPAFSGYHYPTAGIAALVEELHTLGYIQRIAANISPHEYTRLAQAFPHFFAHFKELNPVLFDGKNAPLKKPDAHFFQEFQQRFDPQHEYHQIFIDEKKANVQAARKQGMIGIRFKNAQQLRDDLKKIGIPLQ